MATKPTPGGSDGTYGTELNAFLDVSLASDGKVINEALQSASTAPVADAALANKKYVDDKDDLTTDTFVNLTPTPQSVSTSVNSKKITSFSLENIDNDICVFAMSSGVVSGAALVFTAYGEANCSITESPEGTFAISGLGDGRTYTLIINTGVGTATLEASSLATGNTVLTYKIKSL